MRKLMLDRLDLTIHPSEIHALLGEAAPFLNEQWQEAS
jgi:hypothetical protein